MQLDNVCVTKWEPVGTRRKLEVSEGAVASLMQRSETGTLAEGSGVSI